LSTLGVKNRARRNSAIDCHRPRDYLDSTAFSKEDPW
jgi:hypothetical protein